MLRSLTVRVLFVLTTTSVTTPVWAQGSSTPVPFTGLLGGARQQTQSLNLGGSLFGVYQETLLPPDQEEAARELDPRFQKTGTFGGVSGSLTYSYTRGSDTSSFSLSSHGTAATYTVSPDVVQLGFGMGAALTTKLTRRIDFRTSASSSYSPFYGFDPSTLTNDGTALSGIANTPLVTPESQFGASSVRNISASGSVGLTGSISRRSSVYSDLTWNRVYFLDAGSNDYWSMSGRAGLSHRLTRQLGFHAGYSQSVSQYPGSNVGPTRTQGPDIGLDFGDAATFALTRRTSVSFGASATSAYSGDRTRYALTGNASIMHSIGRGWSTMAGYNRSFGFVALFRDAVLSDSINGSFGGRLAPRVSWSSGAGWSRGQIGFDNVGHYTTYSANSGVQVAIVRMLSAYAQYGYSRYQVPPGSTTLSILSTFSRQSVSVGLTTSVPLINVRSRP